jgi:hypothetical protein
MALHVKIANLRTRKKHVMFIKQNEMPEPSGFAVIIKYMQEKIS